MIRTIQQILAKFPSNQEIVKFLLKDHLKDDLAIRNLLIELIEHINQIEVYK